MNHNITRREALKGLGAIAGAGLLGGLSGLSGQALAAPRRKRVLRLAHITDVHVQPERGAPEGLAACLNHIQSLKDKPNLVINTGDCIMDSMAADADRTKAQWDVWRKVMDANLELPIEHAIGNHDVWGVNKASSKTTGDEPLYGKRMVMDRLGMAHRYHRFDRGGWRFLALDSTYVLADSYTAKLDETQFEWLKSEIEATPEDMPIAVMSHIPILAACVFMDGENEKTGNWVVPGAWMHIDARRLKDLFYKHPNVKVALSGHEHLVDRVEYNGVTYLCNGSVGGAWWGGSYHEPPPGYAVVDFYNDGSVEREYLTYGPPAK